MLFRHDLIRFVSTFASVALQWEWLCVAALGMLTSLGLSSFRHQGNISPGS